MTLHLKVSENTKNTNQAEIQRLPSPKTNIQQLHNYSITTLQLLYNQSNKISSQSPSAYLTNILQTPSKLPTQITKRNTSFNNILLISADLAQKLHQNHILHHKYPNQNTISFKQLTSNKYPIDSLKFKINIQIEVQTNTQSSHQILIVHILSCDKKGLFIPSIIIFQILMGNNSSVANLQVAQPLGPQWIKQTRQSYCAIIKNIQTGQQAEQYLVLTNGSIPAEFQRYDYRLHQNQSLVSAWAVESVPNEGVCNNVHKLLVTTERIPLRLSQVSGLNFQDSLTIIYSSLIGFQAIHEVEGYVATTDQMIGFTPDNRVKVWLSQNFSENHPEPTYLPVNRQYSAGTMIQQILSIIEAHSAEPEFSEFKNYFFSRFSKSCSFATALGIVRQYLQLRGITISNRISFTGGIPREIPTGQFRTSYLYPANTSIPQTNNQMQKSAIIQTGQPIISTFLQQQPYIGVIQHPGTSLPIQINQNLPIYNTPFSFIQQNNLISNTSPILSSNSQIVSRVVPRFQTNLNRPLTPSIYRNQTQQSNHLLNMVTPGPVGQLNMSHVIPKIASHSIQNKVQNISASHITQNLNIHPVSLIPRDIAPKNFNAVNRLENSNLINQTRIISNPNANVNQINIVPLKNQNPRRIIAQPNLRQLNPSVANIPIQNQNIIRPPAKGLFPTVQNDSHTPRYPIVVDNNRVIKTDKVPLVHPRSPITNLPQTNGPNQIAQGLQNVIQQIDRDISVASNVVQNTKETSVRKEDDLIEYIKGNLDAKQNVQNKDMIQSFGEKTHKDKKIQTQSQQLLSKDVKNLLRNYQNGGKYQKSGYAIDSNYKFTSNIQDPIVVFNESSSHRVQSKGLTGKTKYQFSNQYNTTSSWKPSDDYEALKAKYSTKFETNKEATFNDYDFKKKYQDYRVSSRAEYEHDFKTSSNLGESKYLKDYAPLQNIDDSRVVFNTRKAGLISKDLQGYKTQINDGDNYNSYRNNLKRDKNRYDFGVYDSTGYDNAYSNNNYRKYSKQNIKDVYNDHEEKYYGNSRVSRNYRQEQSDRYYSKREPHYINEQKYKVRRPDRSRQEDRKNREFRYEKDDRHDQYDPEYDSSYRSRKAEYLDRRQPRNASRKSQSRNNKRNISYNDLRSLLYD